MLFSRVFTASTALLCKVLANECITERGDAVLVPKDLNSDLEMRQELFFPENKNRLDRAKDLQDDLDGMEDRIASFWAKYENKEAFYQSVFDEIAQVKGFRDSRDMIEESITKKRFPTDREDVKEDLEESAEQFAANKVAWFTMGGVAATAATFEGAVGLRRLLPTTPRNPGNSWTSTRMIKNWVRNRRIDLSILRIKWHVRRGTFSSLGLQGNPDAYINILRREKRLASLPRGWKFLSSFADKLMVLDVVFFVGELFYEGFAGRDQMAKLRGLIKEGAAARFYTYVELRQLEAFEDWQDIVIGSYLARANDQHEVNIGVSCYSDVEDSLRLNLAQAAATFPADQVVNLTSLYSELKEAYDSGSWTNEDPGLEVIIQMAEDAADEEGEEEEEDDGPDEEYVITGEEVPASELRYLEFKSGKGAIWKLNGPQWSIQFKYDISNSKNKTLPIDIDGDGEVESNPDARAYTHHMMQLNQTQYPNMVFLQTVVLYEAESATFDSKGAITVLDINEHKLWSIPSGNKDEPKSNWQAWHEGFEMDVTTLTNQVPANPWTMSAVYTSEEPDAKPRADECNKNTGWRWRADNDKLTLGIGEKSRNSTLITSSGNSYKVNVEATADEALWFKVTTCPIGEVIDCYENNQPLESEEGRFKAVYYKAREYFG